MYKGYEESRFLTIHLALSRKRYKICINHKGMVVVPYVKGLSEAFARILKSHGIATANRPHRTLRNFVVHPKDKVKDEEKTELIYRVLCRTVPAHTLERQAGSSV